MNRPDGALDVDAVEDAADRVEAVAALVECVGCACVHGYELTEEMACVLADGLRLAVDALHAAAASDTSEFETGS